MAESVSYSVAFLLFAGILFHLVASSPSSVLQDDLQDDSKIVGGQEVEPGSLPYMVALYMNVSGEVKYHCGGAIISAHHVLTAAHCVTGWHSDKFTVVAGAHDLASPAAPQVSVGVAEVTVFELFYWEPDSAIPVNDIALLRLASPLTFGEGVDAVPMPDQDEDPAVAEHCVVSGWGALEEGGPVTTVLHAADVPVIDQSYCEESYPYLIAPTMMCAGYPTGHHDACAGDSGGPLVCGGLLQGIVSWGSGCAEPLKFGVYTRVSFFRDWVEKHNYIPV
ncbi:trypsin-like [Penaeus japonicus]|uniref:trypsin-like n=1 Tax=Penaeus japonicus TaxID=27405 RepID=UPI001C711C0B|nr:trypsin-like [Penaeus japonicus]